MQHLAPLHAVNTSYLSLGLFYCFGVFSKKNPSYIFPSQGTRLTPWLPKRVENQTGAFNLVKCHRVAIRCHCTFTSIPKAHAAWKEVTAMYRSRCKRTQRIHPALKRALRRSCTFSLFRPRLRRAQGKPFCRPQKLEPTSFSRSRPAAIPKPA